MRGDDKLYAALRAEYDRGTRTALDRQVSRPYNLTDLLTWVMHPRWLPVIWSMQPYIPWTAARFESSSPALFGIPVLAATGFGEPRLTDDPSGELRVPLRARPLTMRELMTR